MYTHTIVLKGSVSDQSKKSKISHTHFHVGLTVSEIKDKFVMKSKKERGGLHHQHTHTYKRAHTRTHTLTHAHTFTKSRPGCS